MEFNVRVTTRVSTALLHDDDRLSDVFAALQHDQSIMGPSLSVDLEDEAVSVLTDVEGPTLEEAERIAWEALERALAAVGAVAHRP
jgi:hypothetical protein